MMNITMATKITKTKNKGGATLPYNLKDKEVYNGKRT